MTHLRTRRLVAGLGWVVLVTAMSTGWVPAASAASSHRPRISIQGFDFGYHGVPSRLQAGHYDVVFHNTSRLHRHDVVYLKLAPGHEQDTPAQIKDGAVQAHGPGDLGPEFSATAGHILTAAGDTVTRRFHFDRGRYVVLCFVKLSDGTPHYRLGEFDFTPVS